MKVLVAGATGRTGKHIITELVKENIAVKALVRNREKGQEILPKEAELVIGDVLDNKSLEQAIASCDTIICATGATPSLNFTEPFLVDYQGTNNLINLAKKHHIKHFILVSSLCVSNFFHPLNLFWLVLYWKKQAEKDLINSGLTYTIVRPGGLKENDNSDQIILTSADTLFQGSIPRQKVAQICVKSLTYPQTHNQILEIIAQPNAPQKTWEQLFAGVTKN
jgi:uncharacterized protein YbjT (DUF2867 family)